MFRVLLFSLCVHAAARAEVVSSAVGFVQDHVVTSREVKITTLVGASLKSDAASVDFSDLRLDSKTFAKATQTVLLDQAVALEARNFNVVQLSEEEISRASKIAHAHLGKLAAWKKLEVSAREFDTILREQLRSAKFIQFRAKSSVLPVADAEAQKYFADNRLKFGNLPFENFKENIKSYLSRTQVDRRLKDWYQVLLNKYHVKNLISEI